MALNMVLPNQECIDTFNSCSNLELGWMIMKLNDQNSSFVLHSSGPKDDEFANFKAKIPQDQSSYLVFNQKIDFKYRLIFVCFTPSSAGRMDKMIVSSTQKDVREVCYQSGAKYTTMDNYDDINEGNFILFCKI